MNAPEIMWDVCQSCSPCLARTVCKTRAIVQMDIDEPPYIDYSRCTNCVQCVLACACGAIVMHSPHLPEILK